jgi:hypothetical protein
MKRTIDQVEVGDDCTCSGRPAVVLHVGRDPDEYVLICYQDTAHDDESEWYVPVGALDFDWEP